jgi:hypothetical protein
VDSVLVREADRGGRPCLRLGHSQVDRYLDFVSARAVVDCYAGRKRRWVPTNTIGGSATIPMSAWWEFLAGTSLIVVPAVMLPHLLYLPCTYVFAAKFMASPVLYRVYRPLPQEVRGAIL